VEIVRIFQTISRLLASRFKLPATYNILNYCVIGKRLFLYNQ